MRATLDWSHDLLSKPEKALFRHLSVFVGGFMLEAAEVVGATGETGVEDVLGLLGRLVEQSLVTVKPGSGGEVRYGMLEPVRQYALENLKESGEAGETRRRHTTFFLGLAEQARPELRASAQLDWLERLEEENGNLRATMSRALAVRHRDRHASGLGTVDVLVVARPSAGKPPVDRGAAETGNPANRTTESYSGRGHDGIFAGRTRGVRQVIEEALELSRRAGDTLCAAYAWFWLGLEAVDREDFEKATSCLEEALPLFRESGEEAMLASV